MNANRKFFHCKRCGNIINLIDDKGGSMACCGTEMSELIANTVDASNEKHLPDVTIFGDIINIQVGSVPHPMDEGHYIQFIYVETELGGQCKRLNPGDSPSADFSFVSDKPVTVYEYCNLHGLWKTEIK